MYLVLRVYICFISEQDLITDWAEKPDSALKVGRCFLLNFGFENGDSH